jgi:hypothetical protein
VNRLDRRPIRAEGCRGVSTCVRVPELRQPHLTPIFPIEDPGGGHHTIRGGVRVVF